MTAPEERCWFTLDPKAQPVGPYSIADLSGYAASGLVSEVQVFWKEGKPSWDKLSDVPELEPVLKALQQHRASAAAAAAAPAAAGEAAAAAAAAAAGATAGLSSPSHAHPHHAVVLTGKPSDALDVFKNAIAAVEAGAADDTAPDADPAAADGAADRAATPEELEFEDDDGTMYRWDRKLQKYVPAAEADAADAAAAAAAAQQQHDYDMEAMTFVAEEEVIPTLAAARAAEEAAAAALEGKAEGKRAADKDSAQGKAKKAKGSAAAAAGEAAGDAGAEGAAAAAAGSKLEEAEEPKGWFELKVNTSVYVTGLPDDTDVDEVAQHFARCGIIKLDDAGQPRIKLYRDRESGMLKGDGLVTYLKEPSVDIACQILDGAPLRAVGPPLSVTVARFEMKGQQYKDKKGGGGSNASKGGGNASKGSGGGRGGGRVGGKGGRGGKKKQFSQAEKQARKLGWGGFDDVLPPERVTVVLKGMFTLDEAAAGGDSFATELETDVAAECSKLGVVEKVRVFASHPQGIITVRFKQEEPAQACLGKMNGRFFGGHQIVAHMWDGFTSYHIKVKEQETAEEQAARLDAFARELEQQQHAAGAAAATADAAAADAAAADDAVTAVDGVAAAAADDMDVTEAGRAGEAAAPTEAS